MRHVHDHGHGHDHDHDHAHGHHHDHHHGHAHRPATAAAPIERDPVGASVLMSGAATRVLAVLGALAVLWAAVAWALTDLAA